MRERDACDDCDGRFPYPDDPKFASADHVFGNGFRVFDIRKEKIGEDFDE